MKPRKIFISYSHQDSSFIHEISSSFTYLPELSWIDRNSIVPGDVWRDQIQKALKNSYCILFFASSSSVKSREVKLEIDYAIQIKKRVIPVLIEDCELPYEVSNLHHITLIHRNNEEIEIFKQVIQGISKKKIQAGTTHNTAATIIKEVKTANNFYNTVVVPNRFIWYAS